MLDLDPTRSAAAAPRPAATLVLLRDTERGVEVLVMQRSLESRFLGGAVVFPGGRVEGHDAGEQWPEVLAPRAAVQPKGAWWDDDGLAARIAACRESLEEVGVAPIVARGGAPVREEHLASLRVAARAGAIALRDALASLGRALDISALVPLARWVTPRAEGRRFDARFFVARAPADQAEHIASGTKAEAIRAYWETPGRLIASSERGEIALFPPTHRTLELLSRGGDVDALLAAAANANLAPICPHFVVHEGAPVLALPGDPLHPEKERVIDGGSRYVLRGERWVSEDAV